MLLGWVGWGLTLRALPAIFEPCVWVCSTRDVCCAIVQGAPYSVHFATALLSLLMEESMQQARAAAACGHDICFVVGVGGSEHNTVLIALIGLVNVLDRRSAACRAVKSASS